MSLSNLQKLAYQFRLEVLDLSQTVQSIHLAGSFSSLDLLTALYFADILNYQKQNPAWPDRDRFLLSAGHYSPALYVILRHLGWISPESPTKVDHLEGSVQSHPEKNLSQGLEISSGALGQGLSIASGLAKAARLQEKSHHIFTLTSDGEHQEGQTWEAIMLASTLKLNNLINIVDRNQIQIDGPTEEKVKLGNLAKKYKAFGWYTIEIDGHNFSEITSHLKALKKSPPRQPVAVIAHTIGGRGVSFMENQASWHHRLPNPIEYKKAKEELLLKINSL